MALIGVNDLMVVQRVGLVGTPVQTFKLRDLHESLEDLEGKVNRTGDTMTGQLVIKMTNDDPPPFIIQRGNDPVFYFDIVNSSLVFEDPGDQRINKNDGSLFVSVDDQDYIEFDGAEDKISILVDVDLQATPSKSGYRIEGLRDPDPRPGLTDPPSPVDRNYQATNVGYVDKEVGNERIERANKDLELQRQIDIVKGYLDLFAKFSLQGNYTFDDISNNTNHPTPDPEKFTCNFAGPGIGFPYGEITEIAIHEQAKDVSNNPIIIDNISHGDFIGINPVDSSDPDVFDRSQFGVYQIIDDPDAIKHDASNNTYKFMVGAVAHYPINAGLSNGDFKIRIIRNPGTGALTRFEAEQLFVSRIEEDIAEEQITFNKGVQLLGRNAAGATGPVDVPTILDIPELKVYGGLNITTAGGGIDINGVNRSEGAIDISDNFVIRGDGHLTFTDTSPGEIYREGDDNLTFIHGEASDRRTAFEIINDTLATTTPSSALSMATNRVVNMGHPISDMDAVTKKYMEDYVPVDEYVHKTKDNEITGHNRFYGAGGRFVITGATGGGGTILFEGGGGANEPIGYIKLNNGSRNENIIRFRQNGDNQIESRIYGDKLIIQNSSGGSLLVATSTHPTDTTIQNTIRYYGPMTHNNEIITKKHGDETYLVAGDVQVGTTTTGDAGTDVEVTVTDKATFNFKIPKGDQGETGPQGASGPPGPPGADGSGLSGDYVESSPNGIKITKSNGAYYIEGG